MVGDSYTLVDGIKHLSEGYGSRNTYGVVESDNYTGKVDSSLRCDSNDIIGDWFSVEEFGNRLSVA